MFQLKATELRIFWFRFSHKKISCLEKQPHIRKAILTCQFCGEKIVNGKVIQPSYNLKLFLANVLTPLEVRFRDFWNLKGSTNREFAIIYFFSWYLISQRGKKETPNRKTNKQEKRQPKTHTHTHSKESKNNWQHVTLCHPRVKCFPFLRRLQAITDQ